VAPDKTVLDCNDDRHGHERSSAIHVVLTQGAKVQVVVDGFGGEAGPYSLQVREELPLAQSGVLTLGSEVSGDTSRSADDHSEGCSAPAGDDEYRLVVEESGRYVFRIETPGWHPLLSILAEGASIPLACGVSGSSPPLIQNRPLSAGVYRIVVDGAQKRDVGPYRLRVDRADP
jgi:hypothetical protein